MYEAGFEDSAFYEARAFVGFFVIPYGKLGHVADAAG
jgi:hypothetical protein